MAIKDMDKKIYYRNYETYYGSNIPSITIDFITKINTGEKMPLHATWERSFMNLLN
jgi:hypothetical protein